MQGPVEALRFWWNAAPPIEGFFPIDMSTSFVSRFLLLRFRVMFSSKKAYWLVNLLQLKLPVLTVFIEDFILVFFYLELHPYFLHLFRSLRQCRHDRLNPHHVFYMSFVTPKTFYKVRTGYNLATFLGMLLDQCSPQCMSDVLFSYSF